MERIDGVDSGNLEKRMKVIGTRPVLAATLLLSGLWMPAAFASSSAHGGGSGGHVSSGHAGGMAHAGGAHFAGHAYASRGFVGSRATYVGAARAPGTHWAAAGVGHGAVAGTGFRGGRAIGPGYGHGSHWGGGYWRGRYWPGAYYGPGFAWFLASVPLYCSTFWWNNVPYYYYNDVYYTWSPTADGYVATDPPPAAPADAPGSNANDAPYDGAAASATSTGEEYAAPESAPAAAIPPGGFASGGPSVYAYPAKGQTDQQQAADRAECTQWAATQTGGAVGSPDYRRAAIACFQGRGYSAQ
jgi:hypothetical protein